MALTIVVVLATAATALLSSASASATVLCKVEEETCSLENRFATETSVSASLKAGTTAALGPATCKQSSLKAKTLSNESEPLPATISEVTFGECTVFGSACTVSVLHLPYEASIQYGSAGDGTMAVKAGKEGSVAASANCGFGKCTYSIEATLDAAGGEPAELVANKESMKKTEGGFLCPGETTWSATYTVSAPEWVFVQKKAAPTNTVLCKALPQLVGGTLVCNGGTYNGQVQASINAGKDIQFRVNAKEWISCSEGGFTGVFNADGSSFPGGGGMRTITLESGKTGLCATNLGGKAPAARLSFNAPFNTSKFRYLQTNAPQSFLAVEGGAGGTPSMAVEIQGGPICVFTLTESTAFFNHLAGTLAWEGAWALNAGEPLTCPLSLAQTGAALTLNRTGGNLYVAEK